MRIYYFIHLTGRDRDNTGIQRVVRNLGRHLQEIDSVELIPVRWCGEQNAVVHAEQDFLDLISWKRGPAFTLNRDAGRAIHESAACNDAGGEWLLIPEVPHLQSHDSRYPSVAILEPLGYARRSGLRSAVIFHDLLPLTHPEIFEGDAAERDAFRVYGQALLLADAIIPNSVSSARHLAEWYEGHGYSQANIPKMEPVLIPEEMAGVPCRVPDEPEKRAASGTIEFVALGTVCARKNQLRAIEAFNRLVKRRPDLNLRLHVVGTVTPSLASSLAYQLKQSWGRIRLYGYLDDDKLLELLHRSRATIFVSLAEGYGLPVAESLWMGKPCLTSSVGSMMEIARGGGCLTVDPGSVEAIEHGLERLATDEKCGLSLLQELRARRFRTWSDYSDSLVSVLEREGSASRSAPSAQMGHRVLSLRQPANGAGLYLDARDMCCSEDYPQRRHDSLFDGNRFNYRKEIHRGTPQDVLFFGPYITLEPSIYRFHLRGRIDGRIILRMTEQSGQRLIKETTLSTFDVPITLVATKSLDRFELVGLRTSSLRSLELCSIFVERLDSFVVDLG
jgi:glycosyltransferase involved in cell wall biosynthesis